MCARRSLRHSQHPNKAEPHAARFGSSFHPYSLQDVRQSRHLGRGPVAPESSRQMEAIRSSCPTAQQEKRGRQAGGGSLGTRVHLAKHWAEFFLVKVALLISES